MAGEPESADSSPFQSSSGGGTEEGKITATSQTNGDAVVIGTAGNSRDEIVAAESDTLARDQLARGTELSLSQECVSLLDTILRLHRAEHNFTTPDGILRKTVARAAESLGNRTHHVPVHTPMLFSVPCSTGVLGDAARSAFRDSVRDLLEQDGGFKGLFKIEVPHLPQDLESWQRKLYLAVEDDFRHGNNPPSDAFLARHGPLDGAKTWNAKQRWWLAYMTEFTLKPRWREGGVIPADRVTAFLHATLGLDNSDDDFVSLLFNAPTGTAATPGCIMVPKLYDIDKHHRRFVSLFPSSASVCATHWRHVFAPCAFMGKFVNPVRLPISLFDLFIDARLDRANPSGEDSMERMADVITNLFPVPTVPLAPLTLTVRDRREDVGMKMELAPRYASALAGCDPTGGAGMSQPSRALMDRSSEMWTHAGLAFFMRDLMGRTLMNHSDARFLACSLLYTMTSACPGNPFQTWDTGFPLERPPACDLSAIPAAGAFPLQRDVYYGPCTVRFSFLALDDFLKDLTTNGPACTSMCDGSAAAIPLPRTLSSLDDVLAYIACHLEYPMVHMTHAEDLVVTEDEPDSTPLGVVGACGPEGPKTVPAPRTRTRSTAYSNLVRLPGPSREVIIIVEGGKDQRSVTIGNLTIPHYTDDTLRLDGFPVLMDFLARHAAYGALSARMFSMLQTVHASVGFSANDWLTAKAICGMVATRCPMPAPCDGQQVYHPETYEGEVLMSRSTPLFDFPSMADFDAYMRQPLLGRPTGDLEHYSIPRFRPELHVLRTFKIIVPAQQPLVAQREFMYWANTFLQVHDLAYWLALSSDLLYQKGTITIGNMLVARFRNEPQCPAGLGEVLIAAKKHTLDWISQTLGIRDWIGGQMIGASVYDDHAQFGRRVGMRPSDAIERYICLPASRVSREYGRAMFSVNFATDPLEPFVNFASLATSLTDQGRHRYYYDIAADGSYLSKYRTVKPPIARGARDEDPLNQLYYVTYSRKRWKYAPPLPFTIRLETGTFMSRFYLPVRPSVGTCNRHVARLLAIPPAPADVSWIPLGGMMPFSDVELRTSLELWFDHEVDSFPPAYIDGSSTLLLPNRRIQPSPHALTPPINTLLGRMKDVLGASN